MLISSRGRGGGAVHAWKIVAIRCRFKSPRSIARSLRARERRALHLRHVQGGARQQGRHQPARGGHILPGGRRLHIRPPGPRRQRLGRCLRSLREGPRRGLGRQDRQLRRRRLGRDLEPQPPHRQGPRLGRDPRRQDHGDGRGHRRRRQDPEPDHLRERRQRSPPRPRRRPRQLRLAAPPPRQLPDPRRLQLHQPRGQGLRLLRHLRGLGRRGPDPRPGQGERRRRLQEGPRLGHLVGPLRFRRRQGRRARRRQGLRLRGRRDGQGRQQILLVLPLRRPLVPPRGRVQVGQDRLGQLPHGGGAIAHRGRRGRIDREVRLRRRGPRGLSALDPGRRPRRFQVRRQREEPLDLLHERRQLGLLPRLGLSCHRVRLPRRRRRQDRR